MMEIVDIKVIAFRLQALVYLFGGDLANEVPGKVDFPQIPDVEEEMPVGHISQRRWVTSVRGKRVVPNHIAIEVGHKSSYQRARTNPTEHLDTAIWLETWS